MKRTRLFVRIIGILGILLVNLISFSNFEVVLFNKNIFLKTTCVKKRLFHSLTFVQKIRVKYNLYIV